MAVSQSVLASQIRSFKDELIADPSNGYSSPSGFFLRSLRDRSVRFGAHSSPLCGESPSSIGCSARAVRRFDWNSSTQSFVLSEGDIEFQLGSQIRNTVGQIPRCGQLRIDLVLLWATLVHFDPAGISDFMIHENVIDVMLVEARNGLDFRHYLRSIHGIVFSTTRAKCF